MYCNVCGGVLTAEQAVCGKCGSPVIAHMTVTRLAHHVRLAGILWIAYCVLELAGGCALIMVAHFVFPPYSDHPAFLHQCGDGGGNAGARCRKRRWRRCVPRGRIGRKIRRSRRHRPIADRGGGGARRRCGPRAKQCLVPVRGSVGVGLRATLRRHCGTVCPDVFPGAGGDARLKEMRATFGRRNHCFS